MTKWTRVAIVLAWVMIIGVIGLIEPKAVQACSCAADIEMSEHLKNADTVFAGRAVSVKEKGFSILGQSDSPVEVAFEVQEVWKGHVTQQLTIHTAMSSASCGYPFEQGQDYLVYANASEGKLKTGLCGRTAMLAHADSDLIVLGGGSIPPPLQAVAEKNSTSGMALSMASLILLLVAVLLLWLRRRRDNH